jgi:hypothetical protein
MVLVVFHPTDRQGYETSWRAVEQASVELEGLQNYDGYELLGWGSQDTESRNGAYSVGLWVDAD